MEPTARNFVVTFAGETLPGFDPAAVRANAVERLKLTESLAQTLFSGRRAILKRGLSEEEAARLCAAYRKLGMAVGSRDDTPAAAPTPAPQQPAPQATAAPKPAGGLSFPTLIASAEEDAPEDLPPPRLPNTAPLALSPLAPAPSAPAPSVAEAGPAPLELVEESTCPQCGERQPRRTLCRACGIDMPRFIAAQAEREAEAKQPAAPEPAPLQYRLSAGRFNDYPALLGIGRSGRMGRSRYVAAAMLTWGLFCFALALTIKVPGSFGHWLFWAVVIFTLLQKWRLLILRLHDMGHSGWWARLVLVPFVGTIFALALLLLPGDAEENEFGEASNTLGPMPIGGSFALAVAMSFLLVHTMLHAPDFKDGFKAGLEQRMSAEAASNRSPAGDAPSNEPPAVEPEPAGQDSTSNNDSTSSSSSDTSPSR